MWRNWNPLNPPINDQSSEEENNYESPPENNPSELVSPNRPHQSASASPRALLRPDPPPVEEVLADVGRRLGELPNRQQRSENRNAVRQAQEAAAAARAAEEAARQPVMANYDQQNIADEAGAFANARDVKIPFNKHDIRLWFSLIESKMQFAGIGKQWSKRQVLVQLIPPEHHADFRQYLHLQETQAGPDSYYQFKKAILKRFGPKRADGFDKAISRVMTDTPSKLGREILHDICPKTTPLSGCCCADTVLGIWRRSLPSVVRNQIADMDFGPTTYEAVFDRADVVWASNAASISVAATLTKTSTAEVAATGKPNRGGRNNRGGGRGGGNSGGGSGNSGGGSGGGTKKGRGPRHSDNPPESACNVHWRFGKAAWHCADRHGCPWRDYESPKPRHNRNIVAGAEIVD